eukprot:TRINITY_DN6377_c0_g1_i1.p1 TRINITY_DN6377_c0_g1~~TRINITY_DN6377_c0_g1_i1.p1  ORF type:complete len:184 (-),score=21.99 TRINITY_DN6377_c0_g1_i1:4-555(-)
MRYLATSFHHPLLPLPPSPFLTLPLYSPSFYSSSPASGHSSAASTPAQNRLLAMGESDNNLLRKGSVMLVRQRNQSTSSRGGTGERYRTDESQGIDDQIPNGSSRTEIAPRTLENKKTVTAEDIFEKGKMKRFTARFTDPEMEQNFQEYFFEKSLFICRRATYTSILAIILFQVFQVRQSCFF